MVEMQNDPEMKDFFDAVKVRRDRRSEMGRDSTHGSGQLARIVR